MLKDIFLAARPATWIYAWVPVILGSALAYREDAFSLYTALVCFVFATLLLIATSFSNDYFDFKNGVDVADPDKKHRVLVSGKVSMQGMRRIMLGGFALTVCVGALLLLEGRWELLALGVLSLLAAYFYTGGPWPLGYHGFGEVMLFLFFGVAALVGTLYVQVGYVTPVSIWMGVGVGSAAVLGYWVDSYRDVDVDKDFGKRTLMVRWGARFGFWASWALSLGALFIALYLSYAFSPFCAAALFLVTPIWHLCFSFRKERASLNFDDLAKTSIRILGIYGVCLLLGIWAA